MQSGRFSEFKNFITILENVTQNDPQSSTCDLSWKRRLTQEPPLFTEYANSKDGQKIVLALQSGSSCKMFT
eukprot:4120284-Amphidinium_carterae.1